MSRPDSIELAPVHRDEEKQSPKAHEDTIEAEAASSKDATTGSNGPLASEVRLKLLSCCLSFFFAGTNDGSMGPLIPYMLQQYAVSTGLLIVIYVAAFAGWLFAGATNFFLNKHLQLGLSLSLGAVLQILAHALRVWMPPFPLFAVTFLFAALGQAFQDSHSNTFVSQVQDNHRWLGLLHAMYGLGLLVSPFVATPVASTHAPSKWYLFYYFPLGIGVVNLALVLFAFRDELGLKMPDQTLPLSTGSTNVSKQSSSALLDAKATLRLRAVWMLSMFYFFYLGAVLTASGWVVEYLTQVRSGSLAAVGYVPVGISGGTFLGRLLLAEPTNRFGPRRMISIYAVIAIALQLVFWVVPNIVVASTAVSLMSFVLGPFFATGVQVAAKLFPSHLRSSALGLVFVLGQAGGAAFPSLTGLVAARAGVGALQPILVALLALTCASWLVIPREPHKSD